MRRRLRGQFWGNAAVAAWRRRPGAMHRLKLYSRCSSIAARIYLTLSCEAKKQKTPTKKSKQLRHRGARVNFRFLVSLYLPSRSHNTHPRAGERTKVARVDREGIRRRPVMIAIPLTTTAFGSTTLWFVTRSFLSPASSFWVIGLRNFQGSSIKDSAFASFCWSLHSNTRKFKLVIYRRDNCSEINFMSNRSVRLVWERKRAFWAESHEKSSVLFSQQFSSLLHPGRFDVPPAPLQRRLLPSWKLPYVHAAAVRVQRQIVMAQGGHANSCAQGNLRLTLPRKLDEPPPLGGIGFHTRIFSFFLHLLTVSLSLSLTSFARCSPLYLSTDWTLQCIWPSTLNFYLLIIIIFSLFFSPELHFHSQIISRFSWLICFVCSFSLLLCSSLALFSKLFFFFMTYSSFG